MATVRLDPHLEADLERLAQERGQTKSEVIRDAIERLVHTENDSAKGDSALRRLKPWVGIADSGGRQLSRDTGKRFRELLEERRPTSGTPLRVHDREGGLTRVYDNAPYSRCGGADTTAF